MQAVQTIMGFKTYGQFTPNGLDKDYIYSYSRALKDGTLVILTKDTLSKDGVEKVIFKPDGTQYHVFKSGHIGLWGKKNGEFFQKAFNPNPKFTKTTDAIRAMLSKFLPTDANELLDVKVLIGKWKRISK